MKITEIITYKIPKPKLFNRVLNFFAPYVIGPVAIFTLLIIIPFMWIYEKIKTNIFKIKPSENLKAENVLLSNENSHLIKEYYDPVDESKEKEPLYEFFWNLAEYDDEFQIFHITDKKFISDLHNCYVTDFEYKSNDKIILQKLIIENNDVKTYLIEFDTTNGTAKILTEIGNFILIEYNKKKNSIIGFNKTDMIEIKIEE